MRSIAWLLLAAVLSPLCASAADGDLDPAFGTGGIVEIGWPAGPAQANAVGLDHSGRLLVGGAAIGVYGNSDFALFRLLPDGTLDTTYAADGGGFRLIDFDLDGIGGNSNDTVNDLAVLGDGSVVSLGEAHFGFAGIFSQFALARLDATGARESTFGNGGTVHFDFAETGNIDQGYCLKMDRQERLLVAGSVVVNFAVNQRLDYWFGLARLTPEGHFDPAFQGGGFFSVPFWDDPTIPPPRHSNLNFPYAITLDDSNRIVIGGNVADPIPQDAVIYRVQANGQFDDSFGQYGHRLLQQSEGTATALYALTDGRFMVAGGSGASADTTRLFIARINADGTIDGSFGSGGIAALAMPGMYALPSVLVPTRNGGWLVAGRVYTSNAAAGVVFGRVDVNGRPDPSFGNNGVLAVDIGDGRHFSAGRAVLQPDGKLVVAGSLPNSVTDTTPHFALMRILADRETIFADGFDGS